MQTLCMTHVPVNLDDRHAAVLMHGKSGVACQAATSVLSNSEVFARRSCPRSAASGLISGFPNLQASMRRRLLLPRSGSMEQELLIHNSETVQQYAAKINGRLIIALFLCPISPADTYDS